MEDLKNLLLEAQAKKEKLSLKVKDLKKEIENSNQELFKSQFEKSNLAERLQEITGKLKEKKEICKELSQKLSVLTDQNLELRFEANGSSIMQS